MEYRGNNRYRVTQAQGLNSENYVSLAVLYLPCIGMRSMSLYYLLSAEANRRTFELTIERLCRLLEIDIDALGEHIETLEQFRLMRTFYSEDDKSFRFDLLTPLIPEKFLNHAVFTRYYLKKVGQQQYDITCRLHLPANLQLDSDLEVTSRYDTSVLSSIWNTEDEKNFNAVKTNTYSANVPVEFDISSFIRSLSTLILPAKARSKENLEAIAAMGTVFSVTQEDMVKFIGRSYDEKEGYLDLEKLRQQCMNSRKVSTEAVGRNSYDIPPVQFLNQLQRGIPVAAADKRTLESLQVEFKLPREVINYLVERNFNKDRSISKNYLEKVATSFSIKGVDTLEKARKEMEGTSQPSAKGRVPVFNSDTAVSDSEIDYDSIFNKLGHKEENR